MIGGLLPAVFGWRLPRFGIIETVAWSPLLVWALAFVALMKDSSSAWIVPGLAAAFGGAVEIRNRCLKLQSGRALEGSLAVGTGKTSAWRMHVLPELFRVVLSWILQTGGTLLVWLALIDALKTPEPGVPSPSLGLAMAAAEENVLSDLTPLVVPALLVAISALFFRQLGRIVRPVPPPH